MMNFIIIYKLRVKAKVIINKNILSSFVSWLNSTQK